MTKWFGLISILLAGLFISSCLKIKDYPTTPVITFTSMYPSTVRQAKDSILLKFSFTDGDGDIGLIQTDTSQDILIKDIRTGAPFFAPLEYKYRMPYVTPDGVNKSISGDLEITIPNTYCRPGLTVDTLTYSIQIKDRAGHWSNTVQTPKLIVKTN